MWFKEKFLADRPSKKRRGAEKKINENIQSSATRTRRHKEQLIWIWMHRRHIVAIERQAKPEKETKKKERKVEINFDNW